MTDRRSYARIATDLLAEADPSVGAPTAEHRAEAIDAIARAIQASARARRRRRLAFGFVVAAAAGVLLVVGARGLPLGKVTGVVARGGGGVTLSHAGTTGPLRDGAELSRGDRVHVAKGSNASLALSTGTRVEVEGGSDVTLVSKDGDQVFGVESGSTRFAVAKVAAGKRFLVRTADVEVEVRGTAFRVTASDDACAGTKTRVEVSEGLVVVRSGGQEHLVGAGDRWPSSCEQPPAAPPAPSVSASGSATSAPTVAHHATKAATPAAPSGAPKRPSSDLLEQNDLFAEATTKKRNGDRVAAAHAYGRFLARWPGSALAETAAIERMRLLDGAARRDAAKAYLARWPGGSARAEAELLAAP
jgi:hypothetical protein